MATFKMYTRATADVVTPATENTDSTTYAFSTIDYVHREVHQGSAYGHVDVQDQTIDHVYDIQITTPNTTKWAHLTFDFNVEKETLYYFYENVAIVTAGTAITPLNRNRNSTNTSGLTLAGITNTTLDNANLDTTVAGATIIEHGIVGAGKKEGGEGSTRHEYILKQNEDYCLRLIATAAGYVNYHIDWYEHTNKE